MNRLKSSLKRPKNLLFLIWLASIAMLGGVYLAPREYVPSADWWILVSFLTWLYAVIYPLVRMFQFWKEYRRERDQRTVGKVLK